MNDFSSWVFENGGDEAFLRVLNDFGFRSKLSLKNMELDTPDGSELLRQFNCGQKCFLRGLINLADQDQIKEGKNYSACAQKVEEIRKLPNVRSKLNTLFNYKQAGPSASGSAGSSSGGSSGSSGGGSACGSSTVIQM
jgi:exonuclease I